MQFSPLIHLKKQHRSQSKCWTERKHNIKWKQIPIQMHNPFIDILALESLSLYFSSRRIACVLVVCICERFILRVCFVIISRALSVCQSQFCCSWWWCFDFGCADFADLTFQSECLQLEIRVKKKKNCLFIVHFPYYVNISDQINGSAEKLLLFVNQKKCEYFIWSTVNLPRVSQHTMHWFFCQIHFIVQKTLIFVTIYIVFN